MDCSRVLLLLLGAVATTDGAAQAASTQCSVERFSIDVPDAVLDDLNKLEH